jgi:ubiquinone/menaquinone biosynthesis C-methylase UbiE
LSARARSRFSRTLSRNRLPEYESLLSLAHERGYAIVSLEDWVDGAGGRETPTLILRHDVDQHPGSALAMAALEREAGVRSTWYFRWRTADPAVTAQLRMDGFQIGLHFETLTRRALQGIPGGGDHDEARAELAEEIAAFSRLHGPIRSIAPHGDSRVPEVRNAALTRGRGTAELGVEFDGNEAMASRRVSVWLTDRSAAEGGWVDGRRPAELLEGGESPILCLTHPNNWTSGPALWLDRAVSAGLPSPAPDRRGWPLRTRSDRPPMGERDHPSPSEPPVRKPSPRGWASFAPIAASLREQIIRHYEVRGESLEGRSGRATLETNSALAERRGAILLAMIEERELSLPHTRVLDVGCGFGALALFFAHHGAEVVAIDANGPRLRVGSQVAEAHDLPVKFRRMRMQDLPFRDGGYHFAVMNNSLCYVVDQPERDAALAEAHRVLRPGGLLLIRNPNRLHPVDQFTGLPLLGLLPRRGATRAAALLRRARSDVALRSERAATKELRRAGFAEIRAHSRSGGPFRTTFRPLARYQHLSAQRPETTTDQPRAHSHGGSTPSSFSSSSRSLR